MKKSNLLLNLLMMILLVGGFTACKEDDPVLEEEEGLPVADGFYMAKVGEDPVATAQLKVAMVDAPEFSAMSREGFYQSYVYLTAGSYNVVEVVDKQLGDVFGGTVESITEVPSVDNEECETTEYSLIEATLNGAAFSIPSDGLYVVAYDVTESEIVFDEIVSVGIIGGATPGGWGEDTPMTATITEDGISATIEDVTLDVNEMKFRFNCRWAIDRRLDSNEPFDNANGYSFFTNYGGSIDQLLAGNEGSNIQVAEYALYTVTFSWDPVNGATATLTKTGEAEPKPEYPENLYLIGDALNMEDSDSDGTPDGWQWELTDIPMIKVHSNDHLFWRIAWLEAGGSFKMAPVQEWNGDFGKTGDATDGVYAKGSDNVPAPETSGYYIIVANMDKDAETIEVNMAKVYGIGDAFGSWDGETYLFTAEADVLKSPTFAADGDLRMYTTASTFTPVADGPAVDWWQAEFVVLDGKIEYRGTGDDQARAAVTAGGSVSLNFKDGTGTIE